MRGLLVALDPPPPLDPPALVAGVVAERVP
jgi:hypothetical protein